MKWLHLSDIHSVRDTGRAARQLQQRLPKYIKEKGLAAERLFVTGDFRNAAQQKEKENQQAARDAAEFVFSVAQAAGVQGCHIDLVPGNHDLRRTKSKRIQEIQNQYDAGDGRFQQKDMKFLSDRFAFFHELEKAMETYGYQSPWQDGSFHAMRTLDDCSLLYLNTCVLCNSDDDRGKLLVGNDDLARRLQEGNPDKPIIVLAHHGLDNFRSDEKEAVEGIFKDYPILLYLCGDAHETWQRRTNGFYELRMGCLGDTRNVQNAFSYGDLSPQGDWTVKAYQWDSKYSKWGEYTQFNAELEKDKRALSDASALVRKAAVVTRSAPAPPSDAFVGREETIREIEQAFADGKPAVAICGMSGLGKSEICRKLFYKYVNGSETGFAEKVGWALWQGTLENTFFGQFPEITAENPSQYWSMAKERIRKESEKLLLFLDDFDTFKEQDATELAILARRVLITSRQRPDKLHAIVIEGLTEAECRVLYRRAFHGDNRISDSSPDAALDEIVRRAARHPLLVELLAKAQHAAGMSVGELLGELEKSGFNLSGVPEKIRYQHRREHGDGQTGDLTFLEHLERIFDLSQLPADALNALRGMSLLAPNVPISVSDAKKWLGLDSLQDLNDAADRSWLQKRGELDKGVFVSIHPAIAAVVRSKAMPCDSLADAVAGRLSQDMRMEKDADFTEKLPLAEHAKALIASRGDSPLHTRNYAELLLRTGILLHKAGFYKDALRRMESAAEIMETIPETPPLDKALAYYHIGTALHDLEDYKQALPWHQKALRIRKERLGMDSADTAESYNRIAMAYHRLGQCEKALRLHQKALDIRLKIADSLKDNPEDLKKARLDAAQSYHNIQGVYFTLKRYEEALEFAKKAYQIRKELLTEEHYRTATTLFNIGTILFEMGEREKGIETARKGYDTVVKILGKEHPLAKDMKDVIKGLGKRNGRAAKSLPLLGKISP